LYVILQTSVPEMNPKTARISTAREARANKRLSNELAEIRALLDRRDREDSVQREEVTRRAVAAALADVGLGGNADVDNRSSRASKKSYY
jgi:hypothetical protein